MSVFVEFLAPVSAYPLSEVLADHPDASIEVDAVVPTGGQSHYAWITDDECGELVRDVESNPAIDDVTVLDELPDRTLVRFESATTQSPVFDLVDSVGGRVAGAEGTADGWSLTIEFPSRHALQAFVERADDLALGVQIRRLIDPEPPSADDPYDLSSKQRAALEVAYRMGYFDVPRDATLVELAEELGISEQGVSERLRRGLSKILGATSLDEAGTDPVERFTAEGDAR